MSNQPASMCSKPVVASPGNSSKNGWPELSGTYPRSQAATQKTQRDTETTENGKTTIQWTMKQQ